MFSPGAFNDPHTTPQAYFGDACEPSLACRPSVLSRPLQPTDRSPPRTTLSLHAGASRCHPCVGAPQSLSRLMRKTSGDYHYVIKRLNHRDFVRNGAGQGKSACFSGAHNAQKNVRRKWRLPNHDRSSPPKTLLLAYLIRCSPINIFLTSSRPGTACHFLEASTRAGSRHVAFPPPLLPIRGASQQFLDSFHFSLVFSLVIMHSQVQPLAARVHRDLRCPV